MSPSRTSRPAPTGVVLPFPGTAVGFAGVHKRFGRVAALRDVTLTVPQGRVTAILGPNGAGKSTLIRCLLGLVRPDAGVIRAGDTAVGDDPEYRSQIGYMPQAACFPANLTGREVIGMLRDLRANPDEDRELIGAFRLDAELDRPVRVLSGGTRQKLNAAVAFLFRPRLLLLDEPTAGLDPVASIRLKDRIRAARRDGVTVVLTSHLLGEVEDLADEVVFLLKGRVSFHGPLSRLLAETGEARLERAVARLMEPGELS